MDQQLVELIGDSERTQMEIDPTAQTIAIVDDSGDPGRPHAIKPLSQLYGAGTGEASVELTDDTFLPLLGSIEETFVEAWNRLRG